MRPAIHLDTWPCCGNSTGQHLWGLMDACEGAGPGSALEVVCHLAAAVGMGPGQFGVALVTTRIFQFSDTVLELSVGDEQTLS